jgi:hypothetical protein
MPKSIPTSGTLNWSTPLNDHISQLQDPTNGAINSFTQFSGRPTNLTANDVGKTYLYTQTGNIHQWTGSTWKVLNETGRLISNFWSGLCKSANECSAMLRLELYKIIKFTIAILLMVGFMLAGHSDIFAQSANINNLYVSNSGSDTNQGSISAPFKTIQKAQDYIRRNKSQIVGDITVNIRGGEYFVDSTINFEPEDSGSASQKIIYQSYPTENAVIHGGIRPTSSWSLFDSAKNIYRTNLGQLKTYPRQLYVDDILATRARSEYRPAWLNINSTTGYDIASTKNLTTWGNKSDIEVDLYWQWINDKCLVDSVIGQNLVLDTTCFTTEKHLNSIRPNKIDKPAYLENAFELLDEANEWYYNRTDGYLYYKPTSGNPNVSQFTIPQTEKLITVKGRRDSVITNLSFKNLSFKFGAWQQPNTDRRLLNVQAGVISDYQIPFSQFQLEYTDGVSIDSNNFVKLGSSALALGKGVKNTKVFHNTFEGLSGNGISVGDLQYYPDSIIDQTSSSIIYNNLITNIGQQYKSSVGILQIFADNTIIKHNEISNAPYSGMNIGWGWDPKVKIPNYNTIIESNKIHDVMKVLIDGGAIYHNGPDTGTRASYNYIYNLGANNQLGPNLNEISGLYYDNGSIMKKADHNIVQSTPYIWLNLYDQTFDYNQISDNFSNTSSQVFVQSHNTYTNNKTFTSLTQYPEINPIINSSGLCSIKNNNIYQCDGNLKCTVDPTRCGNNNPVGKIDKFVGNKIYYYAKDPDSNAPITSELYIALPTDDPNYKTLQPLGTTNTCNLARSDSYNGFGCEATIPALYLNSKQYTIYIRVKDANTSEFIFLDREAFVWNDIISSSNMEPFVCSPNSISTITNVNCTANLIPKNYKVLNGFVIDSNGLFAGARNEFGKASSFLGNSNACTVLAAQVSCNNVPIPASTAEGVKEIVGHRPNIEFTSNGGYIDFFKTNTNCTTAILPTISGDVNVWGDKLNNFLCQTSPAGVQNGKINSDLSKITENNKISIGGNIPNMVLNINNLDNFSSEAFAIQFGLKNGDFYRTGDQVKVVTNGQNITENTDLNNIDANCYNSILATTLPLIGSTNWGEKLNNFLCKSMSNSSGQQGKLKSNLASITSNNKVGIGATNPTNTFAVNGLANVSELSSTVFKNGDLYITNGQLKIKLNVNTPINVSPNECYNPTQSTRLPVVNQDSNSWGSILNNFLCRSRLKNGKLKPNLSDIVEGGKVGVGTNNPTSVLAVPNLPNYSGNAQAAQYGLKAGDIYRNGNDVMVVY